MVTTFDITTTMALDILPAGIVAMLIADIISSFTNFLPTVSSKWIFYKTSSRLIKIMWSDPFCIENVDFSEVIQILGIPSKQRSEEDIN